MSSSPGFTNRLRINFGGRNKQQPQTQTPSPPPAVNAPPPGLGQGRPPSFPPPYVGPPAGAPHLVNNRPQSPMPAQAPYGPGAVGGPPPQHQQQQHQHQQQLAQQIPAQMQNPQGYGQPPGYPAAGHRGSTTGRPGMQEVEGGGRNKAQLIVGIDFGTTFSGVAFAFATDQEAKEDIITEWPGAGNQTKNKVGRTSA